MHVYTWPINSRRTRTGGMTAAPDVVDSKGIPFGNWVSRSAGGWVAVGTAGDGTNESALSAHGAGVSTHALLFGQVRSNIIGHARNNM